MKTEQGWDVRSVFAGRPAGLVFGDNMPDCMFKYAHRFFDSLGYDREVISTGSDYADLTTHYPDQGLTLRIEFRPPAKFYLKEKGALTFAKLFTIKKKERYFTPHNPLATIDSLALTMLFKKIFEQKKLESKLWRSLTNENEIEIAHSKKIGSSKVFEPPSWQAPEVSSEGLALYLLCPTRALVEQCAHLFSQFITILSGDHHGYLKRIISLTHQANMLCSGMAQIERAMDGVDDRWTIKIEPGFTEIEKVITEMYEKAETKLSSLITDFPKEILMMPRLASGQLGI